MNTRLTYFFALVLSSHSYSQNLAPGEFTCWYPEQPLNGNAGDVDQAQFLNGFCVYQTKSNGEVVINNLLDLSNRRIVDYSTHPQFKKVTRANGGKLIWFLPNRTENEILGKFLQENDRPLPIQIVDKVNVTLEMHSFTSGAADELGFEIGSYYSGNEEKVMEDAQNNIFGNLSSGLFSSSFGLGNVFSSFLKLGIKASKDKNKSIQVQTLSKDCPVGSLCEWEDSSKHYIFGAQGFSSSIPTEDLGLKFEGKPNIQILDDGSKMIELTNLNITYRVPTGIADKPVKTYKVTNYDTRWLKEDSSYVVAQTTTNTDIRSGKILSKADEKSHNKFLVLLQAKVITKEQTWNGIPYDGTELKKFTEQDQKELQEENKTEGEPSIRDIFESLELVCHQNFFQPLSSNPVCGFTFKRMSSKLLKYKVRFELKSGPVKALESTSETGSFSDYYYKKGYYRLPLLDLKDQETKTYKLIVELDKNGIGGALRKKSDTKGFSFEFSYTSGSSDPIIYDWDILPPYWFKY